MNGKKVIGKKQNDDICQICSIILNLCCISVTSERYLSALEVKMNYSTYAEFCQLQKEPKMKGEVILGGKLC